MTLVPIDESGNGLEALVQQAPEILSGVIQATLHLYQQQGFRPPWIGYLGVESGRPVGACGFAAPPREGEIEIAYFTFPGHENRGVGTRLAAGLVALARGQDPHLACLAHTLPQENPSTRILSKLGFRCLGPTVHPEDGTVWKWRLAPEIAAPDGP